MQSILTPGALLIAASLLAGCGSGDESPDPQARKNRAAVSVAVVSPDWQACAATFADWPTASAAQQGRYDCAVIQVPLDYAQPEGKRLDLALRRRVADRPQARIGAIVIEPGGPGGSGVDSVEAFAASVTAEVREAFDIVGFDPRGVGRTRLAGLPSTSPALPCGGDLARYFSEDLADASAGGSRALDAAASAYASTCAEDPILPHMGTLNVARDIEVLRRALGESKLTYFGVSYGTEVGIVYADAYPTHVRAMIIDGVVNPARSGEDILVTQAAGWDLGLRNFFAWCAAPENAKRCAIHADPEGAFRAMIERARHTPGTIDYDGEPIALSSGWITLSSVLSIYDGLPEKYATLADAIAAALATPADWRGFHGVAAMANQKAMGPSVWTACVDQPLAGGSVFDRFVARAAAQAPLTGVVQANINRPCAYLPVSPDPVPTGYRAQGSAPIMVWGSTGDPATPWQNSVDAAAQLANASLFTFEANQHVAMGGGPGRQACVVEVQSAYLLTGVLVPQAQPCRGN